jgi:hypothetical protein
VENGRHRRVPRTLSNEVPVLKLDGKIVSVKEKLFWRSLTTFGRLYM